MRMACTSHLADLSLLDIQKIFNNISIDINIELKR